MRRLLYGWFHIAVFSVIINVTFDSYSLHIEGDIMFWNRKDREKKELAGMKKKKEYEKVYWLHQQASFLCYIDDVYTEEYGGSVCIKLEGTMASGEGMISDKFVLYDCRGRRKAAIEIDEFYVGADSVEKLDSSDDKIVIYPKQQEISYKTGDILCKLEEISNL